MSGRNITIPSPPTPLFDVINSSAPSINDPERVAAEWGLSNWRSKDAFAGTDKRPMRAWAWEFLRRSPEYREAWAKATRPRSVPDGWIGVSPPSPDIFDAMSRFGLPHFLDPREPSPDPRFIWSRDYVPLYFGPTEQLSPLRANQAAAVIDLTREIGPQLALVHAALKPRIKRLSATRMRLRTNPGFPVLLRVLDAFEQGAKPSEIGRVLVGGDDRKRRETYVGRWRKWAEDQRDHGYRWIAAHDK